MCDAELIEAVAKKVMGWHKIAREVPIWSDQTGIKTSCTWKPPTDWNHTMEVAEKMDLLWLIKLHESQKGWWRCAYSNDEPVFVADTGPQRAICFAALQAVSS